MQSKNKRPPTARERRHIERVKSLPCSVCDTPGPSEAHEIRQGLWWCAVALCPDCHRGSHNSIGRGIWRVKKLDELAALAITNERLWSGKEA